MLKVGLIGCGFMGIMHAKCYNAIDGVEVKAVADLRPDKAAECAVFTNADIYPDADALLQNADVDIIDICLPTYLHTEFALKAMDKVKYVFIEKPAALTAAEGDAMLEKSAATSCNVQIGQVIRFWDEYVQLKKWVDEGTFGKVVNASFRRISPTPEWGWNDWLRKPVFSGGASQDLHIHDVDFVLSLFGEPIRVASVHNTLGEGKSYIHTIMQYADFPVGVEGTWGLPPTFPFNASYRVCFEKATMEFDGGKLTKYDDNGVYPVEIEKLQLAGGESGGNISDLGAYYNELKYFTDCAKAGTAPQKARLCDAVQSLKFVLNEIALGEIAGSDN